MLGKGGDWGWDAVGENTEYSFRELPAIDIDSMPVRERYRGLGQ
jgi:hypothetical protein